ncbi:hypothetical protein [Microvirga sp. KLBC 81]|uniref:hypothetical protein n=1 Tax=Microvirga sp. KLBC 81 TaxID=1862707 RepID=UPI0010581733|nr:hypothetical protein [Microvirga sp. KLBC 81]
MKTAAENRLNLPIVSPHGPINDKAAMPESKHTELEEAIEREKDRADTLQQQLNAAQQQVATLKASEARAAELEDMLEQEKERSTSSVRELETLKEQLTALKTSATKAAESEDAAAWERQRADAAYQQLNVLQAQLSVLMADGAKVLADLMREKEQSALTTRQLEAALRTIDVLESRTEFIPGTLAFQDPTLVLFGPPVDKSSEIIEEASIKTRDQDEAGAARMYQEAATAQPAAQDPGLQGNVQPQMQAPGIPAEADTFQKGDPPSQRVTTPVRKRATPRSQRRKNYGQVRWSRRWTGYMGGYGNARGSRTINGPGIW